MHRKEGGAVHDSHRIFRSRKEIIFSYQQALIFITELLSLHGMETNSYIINFLFKNIVLR